MKIIDKLVLGIFIGQSGERNSELNFGKPEVSKVYGDKLENIRYFKAQGTEFWTISVDHIKIGNLIDDNEADAILKIEN